MQEVVANQIAEAAEANGSLEVARSANTGSRDPAPRTYTPAPPEWVDTLRRLQAHAAARSQELETLRSTLGATLENVSQGIMFVDCDGFVVICNQRACELLELPQELMARKPHFEEVLAHQWEKQDFRGTNEQFRSWVRSGGIKSSPPVYERTRPNGVTLEIRTILLPDGGAVRTYTDITEARAREAALAAAEAEYRSLFENAVIGIYRSSPDGQQMRANPALCRLNGYNSEAEMLAAVKDIAREWYVDPGRRDQFVREMLENGRVTDFVSEILTHHTRERIWVSETAWIVRGPDGEPAYFEGMVVDATERKRAEERIAHLAHHDPLTDLPNRTLFAEEMRRVLSQGDQRFAVLCIDLDRFKEVNDTLGHGTGDALLRAAARRLTNCVREDDVVARLGGDEFAVIQTAVENAEGAVALASRMVDALSRPYMIAGHRVIIGASIGIALAPEDGEEAETLLKHADVALYRAKETRGTWALFKAPMVEVLQEKRAIEMDLRGALARRELLLLFQPIVDIATRQPVSYEALLRWNHPERGLILPADFVPIAEETGLMQSIGEWVLREACREAAATGEPIIVSVNLSPVQFQGGNVVETVADALRQSGLEPGQLMLEITESILLMDDHPTVEALEALRSLGVRIALDDFGTGHSSLSYLQKFPFDRIKIDQSFIARAGSLSTNAAIVRAVIGLGRDLGMPVIAEGVETEEQLATLAAEGCGLVQGFLFGLPGPASEVLGRPEEQRLQA